ncbi:MAG TPA: hypothetical protein DEF00_01980 [Candidatus Taylorbacteria bacterium]|nr:MAG: hypothetical protein UY03_C0009G0006 [Parcubacteria group bacterium GW2011_GWA2_47_64]KKU96402.1 MAG: hypothetical protein UY29_C0012G0006 [Parcubacteria group bacterium GW2011_GWC2_48_17]HBV01146.1 hypothetical protein [Candidatus Taylorbacteria bacterium]
MKNGTKNLKSSPFVLVVIIVLVLLVGVVIADGGVFRNRAATLPPSNLLAESGAAGGTRAIVIVQLSAENYPSASFDALSSTQYTSSSLSCRDKAYKDNSAYETRLTKKSSCIANQVKTWLLGQKAGAAQNGISVIDSNLDSSRKILAVLLRKPSSFAVEVMPGGGEVSSNYNIVSAPKIMCVKDRADNTTSPEVPVGALEAAPVKGFNISTPSQEAEILTLKKKAAKLIGEFEADPKKGTADKVFFAKSLRGLLSPLSGRALSTDYATAKITHRSFLSRGVFISFAAAMGETCDGLPAWLIPGVIGDDRWGKTTISFDEISTTACMPYDAILRDATEGISKYISNLEKLKSSYVTQLASFNKQIKMLRDNNYYCDAPVEKEK